MLLDDRELARAQGQAAAAIKAGELIGRELFRMFINRSEAGVPGAFANLPDEALDEALMQKLREAGIPCRALSMSAARPRTRRGPKL